MNEPIEPQKICPILDKLCDESDCPVWLVLDDWQGCALELSHKAVKEVAIEGARFLDDLLKIIKPR